MKPTACVALLADLVDSRAAADRRALHGRVTAALAATNERYPTLDALRITVGDEFQGLYPTLGAALGASYSVRLALGGGDDVRFGIGRGEVQVIDPDTNLQDGSAWWAARAAIEDVERRAKGSHRALRTGLPPDADPLLLTCVETVDALLAGLDESGRAICASLLTGATQADAAASLGISPSAVSQRVARGGIAIVVDAITRLREIP